MKFFAVLHKYHTSLVSLAGLIRQFYSNVGLVHSPCRETAGQLQATPMFAVRRPAWAAYDLECCFVLAELLRLQSVAPQGPKKCLGWR